MKNTVITFAVLGALTSATQAQAYHWGWDPCCVTHCVAYEARTITCYKPEWREEKVDVTVHRMQCKEVVDKVKVTVMVPNWVDEKRTFTVCRYEPKTVVRDVVRCHYV